MTISLPMVKLFHAFVKLTGWPVQKLCFRTKIYYEDRSVQNRHIRGSAILVSNHTSVYDYAVWLFVFFSRTLRFQMAEVLFQRQPLGTFLRCMGGIRVERDTFNFGFIRKSEEILHRGGVVGIFPEGRLPLPGETRPLPFKPSAAYLALTTGVPVIPVYTDGSYFRRRRARVIIGKPLALDAAVDAALPPKQQLAQASELLRKRMMELERMLDEKAVPKSVL